MMAVSFCDDLLLWLQFRKSVMWLRAKWVHPCRRILHLYVGCLHYKCYWVYSVFGLGWWGAIFITLTMVCVVLLEDILLYQVVILGFGYCIICWLFLSSLMTQCYYLVNAPIAAVLYGLSQSNHLAIALGYFWILSYKGDLNCTSLMTLFFLHYPAKIELYLYWVKSLILLSLCSGFKYAQKHGQYTVCFCWYLRPTQLIGDEGKGLYPHAYEEMFTEANWLPVYTVIQLYLHVRLFNRIILTTYQSGWYACFVWYIILQWLWAALLRSYMPLISQGHKSRLPRADTKSDDRFYLRSIKAYGCKMPHDLYFFVWILPTRLICNCYHFCFSYWIDAVQGYSGFKPIDILDSMYQIIKMQFIVAGPCLLALAWHQWMPGHAQIGPDLIRCTILRFMSCEAVISKDVYWYDSSSCRGPFAVTLDTSVCLTPKSDNHGYHNANLVLGLGMCGILKIPTPLSSR